MDSTSEDLHEWKLLPICLERYTTLINDMCFLNFLKPKEKRTSLEIVEPSDTPVLPVKKYIRMSNSKNGIGSLSAIPDEKKAKIAEYIIFNYENTHSQAVADKFGVNKEQIVSIVGRLRSAGILVPHSARGLQDSFFSNFIGDFAKKHPELLKQDPPQGKKWRE